MVHRRVHTLSLVSVAIALFVGSPASGVDPKCIADSVTRHLNSGPSTLNSNPHGIPGVKPQEVVDFSNSKKWAVQAIHTPETIEDLASAIKTTRLPVSIKGGGFSMGGQIAAEGGLVIDMKKLNRIVEYRPKEKTITIEAGATWKDIQEVINKDGLAVKIMQSYNNFQVGGSLSVNVHGRYVGFGPIISSVKSIKLILANGQIVTASRSVNSELFYGAIGGYGGLGVIVEATLDLAKNARLERTFKEFKNPNLEAAVRDYVHHFEKDIHDNPGAVMTNADLYPPNYQTIRSITYAETEKPLTVLEHMQEPPKGKLSKLVNGAMASMEQLLRRAKVYRETVVVPRELANERVVMRNWEASYDVRELLPLNVQYPWLAKIFPFANRKALLQEYFIPKDKLAEFIPKMRDIFQRNNVNVSNVSIRHVPKNTESVLSWSKEDSFALVVYYTQNYGRNKAAHIDLARKWTREMIDEINKVNGSFYLPYQVYATPEQFAKAYPRSKEFLALKKKWDPNNKFTNHLWSEYNLPSPTHDYVDTLSKDYSKIELRRFLKNIFNVYDPDKAIAAIEKAVANIRAAGKEPNDRAVYEELTKTLPEASLGAIKGATRMLSSLKTQQLEMAKQTQSALGQVGLKEVNGYVEIGTVGRYVPYLQNRFKMKGPTYVINDTSPSFSPAAIIERTGGYGPLDPRSYIPAIYKRDHGPLDPRTYLTRHLNNKFIDLADYDMIAQADIPDASVDLVTAYIGLHHAPPEKLRAFVASINRILRPGGKLVLRDHDATSDMRPIAHLAHSTYNAGLGVSLHEELSEIRNFQPVSYWVDLMKNSGFKDEGVRLLQEGDPTANTLMVFTKQKEAKIHDMLPIEGNGNLEGSLNSLPGYHRAQSQTFQTHPEWFIVDAFNDLAAFMKHTPWYEFPFTKYTALYDEIYKRHRAFAIRDGIVDGKAFEEYDNMGQGMGMGLKILFNYIMQPAANQVKAGLKGQTVKGTTELLAHVPKEVLEKLPPGLIQDLQSFQGDLKLLQTERYMPFTEAMLNLAKSGKAQIHNVAGNKFISVLIKTQADSLPKYSVNVDPIMNYQMPTSTEHLHSVKVAVSDLGALIRESEKASAQVVRVHDY
jgi:FAD/FMN-containing dehydrogenase/SAM-dependent methyltransferase